jgi:hypothetical protein
MFSYLFLGIVAQAPEGSLLQLLPDLHQQHTQVVLFWEFNVTTQAQLPKNWSCHTSNLPLHGIYYP